MSRRYSPARATVRKPLTVAHTPNEGAYCNVTDFRGGAELVCESCAHQAETKTGPDSSAVFCSSTEKRYHERVNDVS